MLIKALTNIGKYMLLMKSVFSKPEKLTVYYKQAIREIESHGLGSIGIIAIISLFVGAAITIQTNFNIENPWLPRYIVGVTVRDSLLLEFSSTMVGLVIAGKSGSSIASEIGMMRVTEQIDALEVMGVNPAAFLILPKLIAMVLFLPLLCAISVTIGLLGGYLICLTSDVVPISDYIYGIQYVFYPYYLTYAMVKTAFYAFIIASVAGYFGYHVKGGAVQVGKSSTRAVVLSSILILLADLVLTKLILH
ncbi:MAG: ABC transporter permease [Bacteroidales bacterium]|nr:ABC transporter permease [Bacteroidales bacterium]